MTPTGIRQKFDFFRKWFNTLLVKEFLNLPYKDQERFIPLVMKFLEDCRRVHEEAKSIREKNVKVVVTRILPNQKEGKVVIRGRAEGFSDEIGIEHTPDIKIGDTVIHTVFSIDGQTWYSSKEELIKGRVS